MQKKNGNDRMHRILSKAQRSLPCKLSDAELKTRGRQAAALAYEIESIEASIEGLKSQSKALGANIETKESERRQVERVLRTETEDRQVEVVVEADMRSGTVTERRTDTNEVLCERGMTHEEAQASLFDDMKSTSVEPDGPIDVNPPGTKALPPKRSKKSNPDEATSE
jgi:chromosome segregation ATPase